MTDRPKRERKPTQRFQYNDASARSTTANASSTSRSKRSPKKGLAKGTPTKTIVTGGVAGQSRGQNRGAWKGKSRGREQCDINSDGSHRSLKLEEDELADNIFTSSDPVEDASALTNDPDDLDFEKEDNKTVDSLVKKERKPTRSQSRKIPVQGSLLSQHRREEDAIIEQWYADPYERINPNDITYDQWRLRNLHTLLRNRGWAKVNSRQMAAWLMKCNGYFKEFNAPVKKSRAKKPPQPVVKQSSIPQPQSKTSNADIHNDETDEDTDNDEEDDMTSTVGPDSSQAGSDIAFAAFKASILPRQSPQTSFGMSGLAINDSARHVLGHKEDKEEQDENKDYVVLLQKKAQELNDKLKLENLKRCLNVFHAVYGPEGPQSIAGNKYEHNYFSQNSILPLLRPKAGLRTQGHFALQKVHLPANDPAFFDNPESHSRQSRREEVNPQADDLHVREVLAEDPDFGLTMIPPSQRATEADMKLYYAQFDRTKVPKTHGFCTDDALKLEPEDETSSEKVVEPALIRIQNQESAALVCEQLSKRVFDWETPSSIQGGLPKQSKDYPMHDGQFALKERHVWKELRQRETILDKGGEEAARLLEQEYEDELVEHRRERRRRENAKIRERRTAEREAEMARYHVEAGKRKRVQFSEETIEEEW